MEHFFQSIGKAILTASLFLVGLFGGTATAPTNDSVGASIPIPVAVFQTSLQSSISASDTSMTLVSGTDSSGDSLSGYICFNIDEGTSLEEFVCGTASGTSITGMIRGLDPVDGDLEVTALKKVHRRGASVKVTNYPSLGIVSRILNGDETIPNKLSYATDPTFTDSKQIISKGYADSLAILGAGNADATTQGLVEIATQAEVDAGTLVGGSGANLVATPNLNRGKAYNDYAVDSVGTDAYAITITPAITAYAAGQVFVFKAGTANTGAATLAVSGLTAKTIKKNVSADLDTGDISANQIVTVVYDGTNMQLTSNQSTPLPTTTVLSTESTSIGASSTQFDITNPAGTTFRYTFDGTGTDPDISLANNPIGSLINIVSNNIDANNQGVFVITGAGANYFEVTNASGVVESNKTRGTGYIVKSGTTTWNKPTGLKYIEIEVVGGGGSGDGLSASEDTAAAGGGGGGYSKKTISATSLGSSEYYLIGGGGPAAGATPDAENDGRITRFGSHLYATGGLYGVTNGGTGGNGFNGDINVGGQGGGGSIGLTSQDGTSGFGGSSHLGGGGASKHSDGNGNSGSSYGGGGSGAYQSGSSGGFNGGAGADGVIIITEYYF